MALRLSANDVATQALRVIGEVSPRDTAPRANVLDIALLWLDIEVAHLCATNPVDWMVAEALVVELTAGTVEYTIGSDDVPATRAADGLEFLIQAMVIDGDGNRLPVEIVTVTQYEALDRHGEEGMPTRVAFSRKANKLYIDMAPAAIDATDPDTPTATGVTLELLYQGFAPDHYSKSQSKQFALREAWQKWAILATAYSIGRGPVRRLPQSERDELKRDLGEARDELLAFENDNKGRDQRVAFRQPM
jgi:hypothetical protein